MKSGKRGIDKTEVIDIRGDLTEWQKSIIEELQKREQSHAGWVARLQIVLEHWVDIEEAGTEKA